jgi:hypothetical protein
MAGKAPPEFVEQRVRIGVAPITSKFRYPLQPPFRQLIF